MVNIGMSFVLLTHSLADLLAKQVHFKTTMQFLFRSTFSLKKNALQKNGQKNSIFVFVVFFSIQFYHRNFIVSNSEFRLHFFFYLIINRFFLSNLNCTSLKCIVISMK